MTKTREMLQLISSNILQMSEKINLQKFKVINVPITVEFEQVRKKHGF